MKSEIGKIIDCVAATCALDGIVPSEETLLLCERVLKGELTTEEAISIVITHVQK